MADLVHGEIPQVVRISRIGDFTVLWAKVGGNVRGEGVALKIKLPETSG